MSFIRVYQLLLLNWLLQLTISRHNLTILFAMEATYFLKVIKQNDTKRFTINLKNTVSC